MNDEELRLTCLQLAVQSKTLHAESDEIVRAAKQFEAYLRGDRDTRAKSMAEVSGKHYDTAIGNLAQ